MDRQTKARIDSLLYELRSWDPGAPPPWTLNELAKKFQLDPMVVKRIAEAEGYILNGNGIPMVLPDEDTEPLSTDPSSEEGGGEGSPD